MMLIIVPGYRPRWIDRLPDLLVRWWADGDAARRRQRPSGRHLNSPLAPRRHWCFGSSPLREPLPSHHEFHLVIC
jgi:hypothetical protein